MGFDRLRDLRGRLEAGQARDLLAVDVQCEGGRLSQADAAEEVLAVVTDAEPVATDVATAEVVSVAVALPETIAAAASVAAPADTPLSRAEQLRGLFDTARTDAAIAPAPAQDNAATGVERNA